MTLRRKELNEKFWTNQITGRLDGGGFISVNYLMTLADNALAIDATAHTDALVDALEDVLEAANNNSNFAS